MNARLKSEIRETILNDLMVIYNRRVELSKRLRENLENSLSYVRDLAAQLSQPSSGQLVPKKLETIAEVFQENLLPASSMLSVNEEERKESEIVGRRAKREASKRAVDNIKKQCLIINNSVKKVKTNNQTVKREKSAASSSNEDNDRISKYSRVEESQTRRVTRKQFKQIAQPMEPTELVEEAKKKNDTKEDDNFESPVLRRSSRTSSNTASFKSSQNREVKNVDDAIVAPNADDVKEPSMYEDAIGKPVPVMNSILKHSLLNATILLFSDDEIPNTPVKTHVRDAIAPMVAQESKTIKSNALFSPYAKESVKKRVEAIEQAVMHSPKPKVDVDAPTRITRTKTRAMAKTVERETETKNAEKSVAQILARKSLVKAKRILLAKQKKNDEFKEVKESVNKGQLPERTNKLLQIQTDKINVKQTQQLKTTSLSKIKLMQSTLPVNRLHTPLNTQNLSNYSKTLTASRANIITNMESLIPPPKSTTKTNTAENQLDEKRRPEDARKKREEALRLQTEEKRRKRQEKELKNKLAREAKEKQELEKRQRAEREREEKAKLALAMQEKQREEMERKRLVQLQRAQEKEERRKLEEQQKLQRLQEQEEVERSLAEQRRREQEAEKRREAEARAQQAAAEALRSQKNQLLAVQAKHKQQANNKHQGATVSYVLDSEPDDDESDDESRPKHEIPHWAQAHVRKAQLAMQLHIPDTIVYKFFNTRKCTPDLTELFLGIDRSRLKRTSSAIWKTPPRISMMETEFEIFSERDFFSDFFSERERDD